MAEAASMPAAKSVGVQPCPVRSFQTVCSSRLVTKKLILVTAFNGGPLVRRRE